MKKNSILFAVFVTAAFSMVNAWADTVVVNSVTFTTTPINNTVAYTSYPLVNFTPTDQSFTVDAQAFTVSFAPVTVNVPTLSESLSQYIPETTTTTGGVYIPHTLPPQYTPTVTTTTPSHTQSLEIALNPFSFTLGAKNNIPLNVPCSGSVFCIAPQSAQTNLAVTGSWTFTDTNVSGQQTGSFTEFYKLSYVTGSNLIDLGQWPSSATLQTTVTALYYSTGATGDVVTPLGSINAYVGGIQLSNGAAAPIPVPSSVWLLISGIGGLGVIGKKRKQV